MERSFPSPAKKKKNERGAGFVPKPTFLEEKKSFLKVPPLFIVASRFVFDSTVNERGTEARKIYDAGLIVGG